MSDDANWILKREQLSIDQVEIFFFFRSEKAQRVWLMRPRERSKICRCWPDSNTHARRTGAKKDSCAVPSIVLHAICIILSPLFPTSLSILRSVCVLFSSSIAHISLSRLVCTVNSRLRYGPNGFFSLPSPVKRNERVKKKVKERNTFLKKALALFSVIYPRVPRPI